jgi:hypothetical protein
MPMTFGANVENHRGSYVSASHRTAPCPRVQAGIDHLFEIIVVDQGGVGFVDHECRAPFDDRAEQCGPGD